jgi:hypothetical protein
LSWKWLCAAGVIGARDILMHGYELIRRELIRGMAEKDVPELLAKSLRLLGRSKALNGSDGRRPQTLPAPQRPAR